MAIGSLHLQLTDQNDCAVREDPRAAAFDTGATVLQTTARTSQGTGKGALPQTLGAVERVFDFAGDLPVWEDDGSLVLGVVGL